MRKPSNDIPEKYFSLTFGYDKEKVIAYSKLFRDPKERINYLNEVAKSVSEAGSKLADQPLEYLQEKYIDCFVSCIREIETLLKQKEKSNSQDKLTSLKREIKKEMDKKTNLGKAICNYTHYPGKDTAHRVKNHLESHSFFRNKTLFFEALLNLIESGKKPKSFRTVKSHFD